jgi:hypothetical protein
LNVSTIVAAVAFRALAATNVVVMLEASDGSASNEWSRLSRGFSDAVIGYGGRNRRYAPEERLAEQPNATRLGAA